MNVFRFTLIVLSIAGAVVSCGTICGCFGMQRDAVNAEHDARQARLDAECKANMTEWCRTQYVINQRNRESELDDVAERREGFRKSMQGNQPIVIENRR